MHMFNFSGEFSKTVLPINNFSCHELESKFDVNEMGM
jgi:hypothetical protein